MKYKRPYLDGFVIVNLDDVDVQHHLDRVCATCLSYIVKAKEVKIYVNMKKNLFAINLITHLGYIVNDNLINMIQSDIQPNPLN